MEEAIVRVEHLSHRYSVQWAIRDINFEINQKGILGLLGSNGAGKIDRNEYYLRGIKPDGRNSLY